ncbi:hypothetical protein ACFXJM_37585 [Streptomyces massasporeus]
MDQVGLQVRRADHAEVAFRDRDLDLARLRGRGERQHGVGVHEPQERGVVAVHDGQHRYVQVAGKGGQDLGGIGEAVPGQRQAGAVRGLEAVHDHKGQALHV